MTHDASSATLAILVRFTYDRTGTPTQSQYTNSQQAQTHTTEGLFTSVPTLKVDLPALSGSMNDQDLQAVIQMDARKEPVVTMANLQAHAPVFVEIYSALTDDIDGTLQMDFAGELASLRIDERNQAHIKVDGIKAMLRNRPLGIVAATSCQWRLGDKMCAVDIESLEETGTVDAINGSILTVSGLTTTTGSYWHRGFVRLGGLRILVRQYTSGNELTLARQAPDAWDGQTVTLTPGCDKLYPTCVSRFSNQERFCAPGIAIPNINPLVGGL